MLRGISFRFPAALLCAIILGGAPVRADECVFAATAGFAAIAVHDVVRDRLTGFIPVGERPAAVVLSADGTRAWAANEEDHTVTVIDLKTRRIVTNVAVGFSPTDVAVHPDATRVYISERRSNRLSVIDAATSQIVDDIGVQGDGPAGIAITGDGQRAFVANSFSNSVVEIDLIAARPLGTVRVGEIPFEIDLTPDDSRLYVANVESGSVSVIRTADRAVVATIPVGGNPTAVAVHPSGATAYAINAPLGSVSVIDTQTNTVSTTVAVEPGTDLSGIALSEDGQTAFVTDFIFANLHAIDTNRNEVRRFSPLGGVFGNPEDVTVTSALAACPRSPVPLLTLASGAEDSEISLERADLLPPGGTLWIEGELVTYEGRRIREAVLNVHRGERGTQAGSHEVGTAAYLVGEYGDANCDGEITAADLAALPAQIPDDFEPCGGDANNDATITPDDVMLVITELFFIG